MGLLFRRGLVMFGPREQMLSSNDAAVNQFFNARRQGPIGMAEEKDAASRADENEEGAPRARPAPIPPQIMPSNGLVRRSQRRPGAWLQEHGVQAPPGSFVDDEGRDWLTTGTPWVARRPCH